MKEFITEIDHNCVKKMYIMMILIQGNILQH